MTPEQIFLDEVDAAFQRYRDSVQPEQSNRRLGRFPDAADAVASLVGRIARIDWETQNLPHK